MTEVSGDQIVQLAGFGAVLLGQVVHGVFSYLTARNADRQRVALHDDVKAVGQAVNGTGQGK